MDPPPPVAIIICPASGMLEGRVLLCLHALAARLRRRGLLVVLPGDEAGACAASVRGVLEHYRHHPGALIVFGHGVEGAPGLEGVEWAVYANAHPAPGELPLVAPGQAACWANKVVLAIGCCGHGGGAHLIRKAFPGALPWVYPISARHLLPDAEAVEKLLRALESFLLDVLPLVAVAEAHDNLAAEPAGCALHLSQMMR